MIRLSVGSGLCSALVMENSCLGQVFCLGPLLTSAAGSCTSCFKAAGALSGRNFGRLGSQRAQTSRLCWISDVVVLCHTLLHVPLSISSVNAMQAVEGGNADSAGMGPAFDQQTSHLTPSHAAILSHCLRLIALEEEGLTSRRAEIWNMSGKRSNHLVPILLKEGGVACSLLSLLLLPSPGGSCTTSAAVRAREHAATTTSRNNLFQNLKHFMCLMTGQLRQAQSAGSEREKLGKCMANLAYVPGSERQTEAASGGLDWVYTFSTATAACREAPPLAGTTQLLDTDLGDVGIAEKELVVVSVEGEQPVWMQRKNRRWVAD